MGNKTKQGGNSSVSDSHSVPKGCTFQSCVFNVKEFQCFSNGDISLKNDSATATMLRTKTHSPTWKEKTTTRVHSGLTSCSQLGGPAAPGAAPAASPLTRARGARVWHCWSPQTHQEKPRCISHLQPRGPSCAAHSPNVQSNYSQVTGFAGRRLTWVQ